MDHKKKKIIRDVRKKVGEAIGKYNLIENGDRIMVAISGGKDSFVLLDVLSELYQRAPIEYELVPVTLDAGFDGFDIEPIRKETARIGFSLRVEYTNIAIILKERKIGGGIECAFCSRLRRGALYSLASKIGCNKIALGHHADDVIETLLLNQFFTGELRAMPPVMTSNDGRNVVIRPLCFVWEKEIYSYAIERGFTLAETPCPLKGRNDYKRKWVKSLLKDIEKEHPYIKNSLLAATSHVRSKFLMDKEIFDF